MCWPEFVCILIWVRKQRRLYLHIFISSKNTLLFYSCKVNYWLVLVLQGYTPRCRENCLLYWLYVESKSRKASYFYFLFTSRSCSLFKFISWFTLHCLSHVSLGSKYTIQFIPTLITPIEAADKGKDETTIYIEAIEGTCTEETNNIKETRKQDISRRDITSAINQAISLLSILFIFNNYSAYYIFIKDDIFKLSNI